jgi:hypothetical protein
VFMKLFEEIVEKLLNTELYLLFIKNMAILCVQKNISIGLY